MAKDLKLVVDVILTWAETVFIWLLINLFLMYLILGH